MLSEKLSLVLEAKRPLTRRRLEESIKKIQVSLEHTLQRKAYTEAGPLQDELETLLKRRQELPTMTELKDAVVSAEVALASAASNRDFAEAASAQQRLDRARKTLQATIEAEDESDEEEITGESDGIVQASLSIEGVECRGDLETEISSLQEQVSAAIARKDFKSATNLQAKLDSREALRAFFPSRAELEVELANKRKELADAVAIKDFAEAGRLNGVIERLEQQIKNEEDNSLHGIADEAFVSAILLDGETKAFSSRFDLEEEIKSLKSSQSEAVARREFKQAETCQRLIESLENLRTRLPTAAELSRSIRSKKSEMQKAIVEKRFAEAEALDIEIIKLEKKLTEEKSKNPPESAAPKPVNAALEGGVKAKVSVTPAATSSLITNRCLNEDIHQNRNKKKQEQQHTTVSALRPRKPVVSSLTTTVLEICKVMTDYRSDAALLVDEQGRIAGIITDTDVTRKVVAKHIDPNSCPVLSAMTASPTCVKVSDSADSALATMLENHFRHLPVLDDDGVIVGLLDIAKCLNDAISKLEEADQRKESVGRDDLLAAITSDERQKARLQTLLGPLLKQTEGQTGFSTTLRAMLRDSPANVVEPTTSVLEASALMADRRKAALVVENGKLTGIFGFKDMMSRVVAKQLPLDLTEVHTVMTPHPEFVSPDMTVLEALQTMHDNKFLTLPVCEDDGTVVGMVDVMDVIKGCGGVDGWRSAFGRSFENDVITESPSFSRSIQSSKETGSAKPKDGRLVSKLRPKKPILSSSNDSILAVTRLLASKRGSAALVVSGDGNLAGILTDKDVTTRVVAKHLEATTTLVSHVMTKSPTCVSMNDTAINAMSTMIENQFRHLPVVDENGGIVGLLDIAKCLNDALSKLEKSQMKSKEAASDALLQAVSGQGSRGDQALALQALLGPLMSQAFGSQSSPPLRSILNQTSCSTVTPDTSVLDAAMVMAETRKASLVVEDGHLAGIFGFKDMMTRVVAKELSLETTEISAVMTPSPEIATPDMTVLEALQMMHDNNFLTLPVCEDDGTVLGVVDVMDLIHGSGGSEGWRSIFNSTLDLEDNSDTASFYSGRAGSLAKSTRSNKSKRQPDDGHSTPAVDTRMVSKLRPRKPIVANSSERVLAVTQILANKRGDAALIVGSKGELKGIFTDTDVTRRVVAKHLDPSSIVVSKVMTKNPTCVAVSDLAMDAMSTMVENHFRHLPVIDDSGGVVGLLDIAKCLNDAISKLEKAESSSNNDSASEVLKQAVHAQGAKGDQAAAIQALLGPLIAQAFGSQASPSLRSILEGSPGTIVNPKASIVKAASVMAQRRKAALVVEDGRLAGIFSFKDMMTRVVAKQLPLDTTDVAEVMTRNPESVLPETTVLEALQIMHDNKFLTLPVCESDGSVLGLVDVMDLIYGCGGVDGWRSIFNSTLDLDDLSDTASLRSGYGSIRKTESKSTVRSSRTAKFESTVSMLRPKKPIIASADQSILEVAQALASKRASAGIIVDSQGGLAGIITDTDFTRRVTAQFIDPSAHSIGEVMTSNPKYVSEYHSAVDAMITMIKNGFRHLPVSDEGGEIVGILDIAKCLNDAIRKLERAAEKSSDAAENLIKQALESAGQGGAALKAILGPLVNQTFGSQASRTLGSILIDSSPTVVESESSVLEAALLMAESRKAALVQEDGKLTGIFGFKDLMCRVVAKELDPGSTQISEVMTPNPEYVSPDVTVLEALQSMHDNHFLTLPVCKSDGSIVGVVNVMDVINGCGGAEGWRAVFDSALELDDDVSALPSAAHSQSKSKKSSRSKNAANHDQVITVSRDSPFISPRSGNIPTTLEFNEANRFDEGSFNDTFLTDLHMVTFKVVDKDGHTHRLKADPKIASLQKELAKKIGSKNPDLLRFKFLDDEGDAILITTDDDLLEAVKLSRAANNSSSRGAGPVVKLIATEVAEPLAFDPMVLAGVGVAVALVGLATMYMMRPRRYL